MKPTIIVSTYNNIPGLRNTLFGLLGQSHRDFEIIVADDGSKPETREALESEEFAALRMRHLWHEDDGFRKSLILNRAIAAATGDYVIFVDGDCIARDDFIATHLRFARPGWYVSGWRVDVEPAAHQQFTPADILEGRVFDPAFLTAKGEDLSRYRNRFSRNRLLLGAGDVVTYRWRVFHGNNGAAWRKDLLKINGFDEAFLYGSEDRDLGARLARIGVKGRYAKFSLMMLHQNHGRSWAHQEIMDNNRRIFKDRLWGRDQTSYVTTGIDSCLDRGDHWTLEDITPNASSSKKAA